MSGLEVPFSSLYEAGAHESLALLRKRTVDLSEGIYLAKSEAATVSTSRKHVIARNKENALAHHDMILYSEGGAIPIQVKDCFMPPSEEAVESRA